MGGADRRRNDRLKKGASPGQPRDQPPLQPHQTLQSEWLVSALSGCRRGSPASGWGISPLTASTLQEYGGKLEGAGRWENLTGLPGPLADALRHFTF